MAAGTAAAALTAAAIGVMELAPALGFAYPFVLLPLLFVGPLAARRPSPPAWRVGLAGLIAGTLAAVAATTLLAVAASWLGDGKFALIGAASAPPMPALPRPTLASFLSWPQQDVLLLEPPLAAILALLYGHLVASPHRGLQGWLRQVLARARVPVRTKLGLAFILLGLLTLGTAWMGFGALEDIHLRGHYLQLVADWQGHVDDLGQLLAQTEAISAQPLPADVRQAQLAPLVARRVELVRHLREATSHDKVTVSPSAALALAQQYRPFVDALEAAMARHAALVGQLAPGATATDNGALLDAERQAESALQRLQSALQDDLKNDLDETDLVHHTNLIAILGLVALAGLLTLVISGAMADALTEPLAAAGVHLGRLARGDFSGRLAVANGDELGRLSRELNRVTAELDRLYQVERAGRTAAEQLAERERSLAMAKEFWAHTIVHDLRGPLTVIDGFAELLACGRLGALSPGQLDAATHVREAASHLLVLVQDILDIFRLEQSRLPLVLQPLSCRELLRQTAEATGQPGRRPVELDVHEPDPAQPLLVEADQRLLLRALENLVHNAFKHAGEQARVVLSARPGPDGLVLFAVDDDGPGIPADHRALVFEPFTQGVGARQGAGLGLTFCRLMAERHGGRVWAEASPLGGARICLALPASLARPTRPAEPPALAVAPGGR